MQAARGAFGAAAKTASRRQAYATVSSEYSKTNTNLRITKDTKLIYQGFTGRQGTYVFE